jgi:S1-C subfamily serine protease
VLRPSTKVFNCAPMRLNTIFVLVAVTCGSASAQVRPPKHESIIRHLFTSHRDSNNLEQRFDDIKCALVLIESRGKVGTGFYISADGDLATASHVVGDRQFSRNEKAGVHINYVVPDEFKLTESSGLTFTARSSMVEVNPSAWAADTVLVKTNRKTNCWLREGDDKASKPGEHLIAIGFPGLSFGSLTIYTGIMSARLTTNFPTIIVESKAVPPPNEFIRIQMPISGGLSGAPVIDDENRVIGIVTLAGGWTADLENLISLSRMKAFAPPPTSTVPPPNTVTLNSFEVTAQLASLFHEYASPGYGDAVPLRYLKKEQLPIPTSSAPDHSLQPARTGQQSEPK